MAMKECTRPARHREQGPRRRVCAPNAPPIASTITDSSRPRHCSHTSCPLPSSASPSKTGCSSSRFSIVRRTIAPARRRPGTLESASTGRRMPPTANRPASCLAKCRLLSPNAQHNASGSTSSTPADPGVGGSLATRPGACPPPGAGASPRPSTATAPHTADPGAGGAPATRNQGRATTSSRSRAQSNTRERSSTTRPSLVSLAIQRGPATPIKARSFTLRAASKGGAGGASATRY